MEAISSILEQRSVVVVRGAHGVRTALLEQAKAGGWKRRGRTGVFALNEGLRSDERFLRAAARALPLTSPIGLRPEEMSLDQIADYWLEWPLERRYDSALVLWPEVHGFARGAPELFGERLRQLIAASRRYAGKPELRFVVTSRSPIMLDAQSRSSVELIDLDAASA